VFLMDPWWNVDVENQAIDRCHRVGQKNPVHVYRLIAKDTIEEQVLILQEKKKTMMERAFGMKSKEDLQKLRMSDLKLLFSFKDESTTQPGL